MIEDTLQLKDLYSWKVDRCLIAQIYAWLGRVGSRGVKTGTSLHFSSKRHKPLSYSASVWFSLFSIRGYDVARKMMLEVIFGLRLFNIPARKIGLNP